MSEVNNLIDLNTDGDKSITFLQFPSPSVLNYNNPSNEIPSTQIIHRTPSPGTFISSHARNSLDNNPFDKIHKEANSHDDPFEMVFNEPDNYNSNNTKVDVITENLLLLGDDLTDNSNTLKIPRFRRLDSKNSIGQLSSVSSIGSPNSLFGENISSISLPHNTEFIKDNTTSITCFDKFENSENSNDLNKGFLRTINIINSTEANGDPAKNNKNEVDSQVEIDTFIQLTDDLNNANVLNIPKFNGFGSSDRKLSSVSSIEPYDSCYKVSCDSNSSVSLQINNVSSILNKKFIGENTVLSDSINKSQLNKAFITSENILHLTDTSHSKENLLNDIYITPDDQSTPNHELKQNSSSSSIQSIQLKYHKNDLRNRLLKLSISNSSINSPLASGRRSSKTSEDCSSLELSVFNEASNLAELYSQLITSSPSSNNISEDSCDDLMSIKPNWIDSKSDIDSDLELLKIPILAEIENSKNKSDNSMEIENNNNCIKNITYQKDDKSLNKNDTEKITSDLDKLKYKIKQHKIKNNTQDINELINGLKGLIFECTQDEKKNEASNLLESLSSLLGGDINKNNKKLKNNKLSQGNIEKISTEINNTNLNFLPPAPQPIIRQDTFDLDLKDDENLPDIDDGTIMQENQDNFHLQSPQSNYDDNSQELEPDLVNIVEQIGKLLGGTQNVNIVTTNLNQNSTDINGQNPTYIVVMGTPSKRKISNNHSPNQIEMRGRSQSLSLHDKRIKLPSVQNYATTPIKECQTPVRSNYIGRRNSISSTTPVRRSIYAQSTTVVPKISSINQKSLTPQLQPRRTMLIETTKNNPSKPIVNFRNDLNTNQLKFKTANNESTIRSKGPLKATIPIKRVAPLIVTSSVTSSAKDNTQQIYSNKPITSTPLFNPSKSASNKNFPKACSTPTIVVSSSTTDLISPSRNSYKNRMRYSSASTTPNTKSNLSVQSSMTEKQRRRSYTNFKSPTKRPLENLESTKTLKTLRFGNRVPVHKSNVPTTLNKENKQPRAGL